MIIARLTVLACCDLVYASKSSFYERAKFVSCKNGGEETDYFCVTLQTEKLKEGGGRGIFEG